MNKLHKQQIELALSNILSYELKKEDAPCSSYQHLATAVQILYDLVPEYNSKDKERKDLLTELLINNKILYGQITAEEGLRILEIAKEVD
jgi:hypothetical protein